jgi:EAL domain-containing protein (putative c-di-GMP-specific phosphodiesterase class I)
MSARNVLVVDDDAHMRRVMDRILRHAGYAVEQAADGAVALDAVKRSRFDAVLTDIEMPAIDGIGLLRAVREHDVDLPVVLITGNPAVETAIQALELGALRYLVKPVDAIQLQEITARAVRLRQMAEIKRQALQLAAEERFQVNGRGGLDAAFTRALDGLYMVYQPIVAWSRRRSHALEALVRSSEPGLANPNALFDAAERLDRLTDVGRAVRARVASTALALPEAIMFVNLHPRDLLDDALYDAGAPLSQVAGRVVLEITERASLGHVSDVRSRVRLLRNLGYRIAVDDLGAGYAGLSSFALLEPDVAKVDMSLVRDVDSHPTKRKLVRSLVQLCSDLGLQLVAEGVETESERDALIGVGCDLLQGYLFARPSRNPALLTF